MDNPQRKKVCVACEGGVPALAEKDIQVLIANAPNWKLSDEHDKIKQAFSFKDFRSAVGFVNEVADEAEFQGHHPDLNLHGWNKVTVTLSTHAAKGLTSNDFVMASEINRIFGELKT